MNKKELVTQVTKLSGLTKVDSSKAVDAVLQSLQESLENGDFVALRGFGRFTVKTHAAHKGINPSTQEPMIVPERKIIKFAASKYIVLK